MRNSFQRLIILIFPLLFMAFLSSCEDPELDALMEEYCDCISDSRYEESKHLECIEKWMPLRRSIRNSPENCKRFLRKRMSVIEGIGV